MLVNLLNLTLIGALPSSILTKSPSLSTLIVLLECPLTSLIVNKSLLPSVLIAFYKFANTSSPKIDLANASTV